jgi:hypothetical protein
LVVEAAVVMVEFLQLRLLLVHLIQAVEEVGEAQVLQEIKQQVATVVQE